MKQKNLIYIIPAIVLMIIIVFLYYQRATSRLSYKESQLFEFDTATIEGIYFDFGNRELKLEKNENQWKVNQKYNLDPVKFDALYQAHRRLTLKSPAPDNISKRLSDQRDAVQVSVRIKGQKKDKQFKMVYDSIGQTGTYVTIPGSHSFYQVFLPGYRRKNLTSLYPGRIEFWRDKTLIAIRPSQIKSISVSYPARPGASFQLFVENDDVSVSNPTMELVGEDINTENVNQYLGYFARVSFQSVADTLSEKEILRIKKTQAEALIDIQITHRKTISLQVFNKMSATGPTSIDPHHFYVKHSDFEDIVIAPFVEIAPLMKNIGYFLKS